MSLTGPVFLGVVVVVTVAAFVVLIILWPALAGRRPAKIAARTGMLLVVNALVLLTAATQLNAQFLFFADWTDLRGAFGGAPTATALARGATASHVTTRKVLGPAATTDGALPPLPVGLVGPTGGISYKVKGPLSGITGTVVVKLPTGYTAPGNASVRYPVIEAFQGYPGSPTFWLDTMNLGGVAAQQSGAKRMRPALIVSPQVEVPVGVDTECVNGSAGKPQLETWLAQDVPNWVTHTFRVQTDRASWAAIGLSAGGWCAAMVAMLHPAQYSAAIVMSGYFRPEFGAFYEPYPSSNSLATRYDLVALAKRKPPPVAIWLETSHADAVSYGSSAALLRAAKPPLAVYATVFQNAGHRISLWQGVLPGSLTWLGANISGFKATP
ncbi:MAG: alpha/beta hydrolase-fold protein [Actinomycetota bacterium]